MCTHFATQKYRLHQRWWVIGKKSETECLCMWKLFGFSLFNFFYYFFSNTVGGCVCVYVWVGNLFSRSSRAFSLRLPFAVDTSCWPLSVPSPHSDPFLFPPSISSCCGSSFSWASCPSFIMRLCTLIVLIFLAADTLAAATPPAGKPKL